MQLHITPSIFFGIIVRSEALGYNSYFFRKAVLRKLFDTRFTTLVTRSIRKLIINLKLLN